MSVLIFYLWPFLVNCLFLVSLLYRKQFCNLLFHLNYRLNLLLLLWKRHCWLGSFRTALSLLAVGMSIKRKSVKLTCNITEERNLLNLFFQFAIFLFKARSIAGLKTKQKRASGCHVRLAAAFIASLKTHLKTKRHHLSDQHSVVFPWSSRYER